MVTINEFIDDFLDTLSANSELLGIRFVKAFPESKMPNPLKNVTVAVSLSSVEVKSALGGYYGVQSGAAIVGGRAEAKLNLRIFSPKSVGAAGCNDAFSKLCGALLKNTELCMQAVSCSQPRHDSTCGVFTADAEITLTCFVGKADAVQEGIV